MRVRVRFAKTGKLRYISAIDLGRVWERALRKADLPIAYSEGFSPHPKISFGDALPLGFASRSEFAELTFAVAVDVADAAARLNRAFPDGIAVEDAAEVGEGIARLGKLLQASMWVVTYPSAEGVQQAVDAIGTEGPLEVERDRKGEMVTADLRPPLVGIAADGADVRAVVWHPGFIPGDDDHGPAVRPDDLHAVLTALGPPDFHTRPTVITRLAQGRVSTDPLGIDDALRGSTTPLHPRQATASTSGEQMPHPSEQEHAR